MINIAEIIKNGVQIEVDALDALYIYITPAGFMAIYIGSGIDNEGVEYVSGQPIKATVAEILTAFDYDSAFKAKHYHRTTGKKSPGAHMAWLEDQCTGDFDAMNPSF